MRLPSSTSTERAQVEGQSCGQTDALTLLFMSMRASYPIAPPSGKMMGASGGMTMTDEWRRTNEWGTLTRAEIAAARDAGALPVLTVGAVEQHSDHLPVDTDCLSAFQITMRAAARCASPH